MVDLYIDMGLPYHDALAACKLCGPKDVCRFKTKYDTLSDGFILTKVVPDRILDDQFFGVLVGLHLELILMIIIVSLLKVFVV